MKKVTAEERLDLFDGSRQCVMKLETPNIPIPSAAHKKCVTLFAALLKAIVTNNKPAKGENHE